MREQGVIGNRGENPKPALTRVSIGAASGRAILLLVALVVVVGGTVVEVVAVVAVVGGAASVVGVSAAPVSPSVDSPDVGSVGSVRSGVRSRGGLAVLSSNRARNSPNSLSS